VVVVDTDGSTPFDLPLSLVLGKMPQKEYHFTTPPKVARPLTLPADLTVVQALDRVLRLVDVGSKRFLTNKVRYTTGSRVECGVVEFSVGVVRIGHEQCVSQ
jgi:phosphoribosylformylglycinamidine synthase